MQSSLKAITGRNILLGVGEFGTEKSCVLFQSLGGRAEKKITVKTSCDLCRLLILFFLSLYESIRHYSCISDLASPLHAQTLTQHNGRH